MCNIPVPAASQLPDTLLAKAGTSHDTDGTSAKIVLGGACSSECNDEDDIACVPAERDRSIHFYDYHIVYLPSYSVPTLLFTGRHTGMLRLSVACAQSVFIATYARLTQWLFTSKPMQYPECSECFKRQHMCVPSFLQVFLHGFFACSCLYWIRCLRIKAKCVTEMISWRCRWHHVRLGPSSGRPSRVLSLHSPQA